VESGGGRDRVFAPSRAHHSVYPEAENQYAVDATYTIGPLARRRILVREGDLARAARSCRPSRLLDSPPEPEAELHAAPRASAPGLGGRCRLSMTPTTPAFHQNAALFGHDATPRLLAFELAGEAQVRLFARAADGVTTTHVREFRPWLLAASTDLLAGWGAVTTSNRSRAKDCSAFWCSSIPGVTR